MPASDPEREKVQLARLRSMASESQLDPAFAEKWFNFVVAEVIHHHEQLATGAITTQAADPHSAERRGADSPSGNARGADSHRTEAL